MSAFRQRAILSLLAAALLWSTGGVLIKSVTWHPLAICGARSAIAAATLWALLGRPRFTWSGPQIGGALAYAASVLLYVSAVKLTSAANAILLQYSAPVWIALFGWGFLGERTTLFDWLTIALSLLGVGLFFRDGLQGVSSWGDVLGALSGVTMAWTALFLRRQKAGSPTESVLLGNMLAAVVGLPFAARDLPPAGDWAALFALGVLQLGLSYFMWTKAIKYVSALEAMIFSMLEPVLNPVWAFLVIGERPAGWALLGGALVLLAVALRALVPTLKGTRSLMRAWRRA